MDVSKVSKQLSWLLRHGANEARIPMDAAGWAPIDAVLRSLRITEGVLERVVLENNKGRLELRGGLVRACQGHSREGMPVTLEALEASWAPWEGTASVWHGTNTGAAHAIAGDKINAGERTHVHLAEQLDSKVGKRAGVAVMLEVSPAKMRAAGLGLFKSANGVVLAREVPARCVVGVRGMTTEGKSKEGELRKLFGAAAAG